MRHERLRNSESIGRCSSPASLMVVKSVTTFLCSVASPLSKICKMHMDAECPLFNNTEKKSNRS